MLEGKETWKDIVGFEGFYQVSNLGRVKSLSRKVKTSKGFRTIKERILKQYSNQKGYLFVGLHVKSHNLTKNKQIHKAVAESFLGHELNGDRSIVVDHINNVKQDNRVCNLQVITQRENVNKSRGEKYKSNLAGASWNSRYNKWKCVVYFKGVYYFVGYFKTKEESHFNYKYKLKELELKQTH